PLLRSCSAARRDLHSFPTRRSSDLAEVAGARLVLADARMADVPEPVPLARRLGVPGVQDVIVADAHLVTGHLVHERRSPEQGRIDRKSTRLNSSHVKISYAVFCLKK